MRLSVGDSVKLSKRGAIAFENLDKDCIGVVSRVGSDFGSYTVYRVKIGGLELYMYGHCIKIIPPLDLKEEDFL